MVQATQHGLFCAVSQGVGGTPGATRVRVVIGDPSPTLSANSAKFFCSDERGAPRAPSLLRCVITGAVTLSTELDPARVNVVCSIDRCSVP
jgi:hypothetical protein